MRCPACGGRRGHWTEMLDETTSWTCVACGSEWPNADVTDAVARLTPAQRRMITGAARVSEGGGPWRTMITSGSDTGGNYRTMCALVAAGLADSPRTSGPPSNPTMVAVATLTDLGERVRKKLDDMS